MARGSSGLLRAGRKHVLEKERRIVPYAYLDAADETVTATRGVRLKRVIVGTGAASAVVTVYNGTTTGGDVVAVINAAAIDNVDFAGLHLENMHVKLTAGNAKVTVVWE